MCLDGVILKLCSSSMIASGTESELIILKVTFFIPRTHGAARFPIHDSQRVSEPRVASCRYTVKKIYGCEGQMDCTSHLHKL